MGCGEIKQTAACCSFRKRLEALTYIDQMLGRQLESWQVSAKGNPGSPGGAVESCFLLVQAQMRPAAAASLPCARGPLPCFPQPHFLSPFPLLYLSSPLPVSSLSHPVSFRPLTLTPGSAVHVGPRGQGGTLPEAGSQSGSLLDLSAWKHSRGGSFKGNPPTF